VPSGRDVLGTLAGSMVLAGTAGCLGSGPDQPILNCMSATNDDAEAHTVHVTVEYEGEPVARESLELAAQTDEDQPVDREWVPRSWPADPGEFVVRARVDDRDHRETLDSDDRDPGRYRHADPDIEEDGTAMFWINAVPDPDDQCDGAPVATGTSTGTE
jgi:hypothetical protein